MATLHFAVVALISGAILRRRLRDGSDVSPPTLLLLRLFGHTSRSERFFDRVISRWRLMSRCDAVVMDVRGLTEARQGVLFELEQLGARLPASRVVLVFDRATDRTLIARRVAGHGTLRMVRAERNSPAVMRRVFETLLDAALAPPAAVAAPESKAV